MSHKSDYLGSKQGGPASLSLNKIRIHSHLGRQIMTILGEKFNGFGLFLVIIITIKSGYFWNFDVTGSIFELQSETCPLLADFYCNVCEKLSTQSTI